ncbi:DUF881 domain-containing protein [Georgenia daeguensis]|uniref:DUF881 domain-containing protein n=1 Tax=Georgenia daeguensis TaxID=908355 RepID=A0ABP8EWK1_9MICO
MDGPPTASTPGPDGAAHDGDRPGRLSRLSVGTGVVGLLAGLLFAANASVFAGTEARQPQDLQGLARAESERLERLEKENADLRADIAPFLRDGTDTPTDGTGPDGDAELSALALQEVHGPGVEVQLWDAPQNGAQEGFAPDDLVVHQQDLEAVMNALWAGGAEAMSVQGHRVVSTTGVRCVGNVLHIAGRTYSPPYVIEAVGGPDQLVSSLESSPGVSVYLQYVDAVGLGWSMTTRSELELPPYSGTMSLQYADVLEDA